MNQKVLCNYPGHETFELIAVCFWKKCQTNRIICALCMQEQHYDHPDDIQAIDDIKNGQYKPIEDQGLLDAIKKIQNKLNTVSFSQKFLLNEIIQKIEAKAQFKLEQNRQSLLNEAQSIQKQNEQIIEQYGQSYHDYYDMTQIKEIYMRYINGYIDSKVFNSSLREYLNSDSRKEHKQKIYNLQNELNELIPDIDFEQLELAQKDIQILSKTLIKAVKPYQNNCFEQPLGKSEHFQLSENGKSASINHRDQLTYFYSQSFAQYPKKKVWTLRFSNYHSQQNPSTNISIGVIQDQHKKNANNIFRQGLGVYLNLVNSGRTALMTIVPANKFLCNTIQHFCSKVGYLDLQVFCDMKNKIIRISCEQESYVAEYSYDFLKSQLTEQQGTQVLQIFQPTNKLRLFVYSSNISMNITLI